MPVDGEERVTIVAPTGRCDPNRRDPPARVTVPSIVPLGAPVAVKVTGDPLRPATLAVAVWAFVPAADPSVHVTDAKPVASVDVAALDRVPPPAVTVQATVTPSTGAPEAPVTRTTSGCPRPVPAGAV
jgi:hypothetical protein